MGNHAIKTFSKRGYQWQLQIDSKHSDVEAHCNISQNKPLQHENTLSKPKSRNHWITIALSGIALLVFTIIPEFIMQVHH
ncbi:hypothetical protein [Pseudoalteromonas sp.]|uniref:hypothetical protein n=1 Tax=Pseudoalteromonas sp. TaxID=53249 RepID=UPI002353D074|nr:hypothetical protein [Pseudoalteromonas sp.]